jgi:hypothetical protein
VAVIGITMFFDIACRQRVRPRHVSELGGRPAFALGDVQISCAGIFIAAFKRRVRSARLGAVYRATDLPAAFGGVAKIQRPRIRLLHGGTILSD